MDSFELHPRLKADTYPLGKLSLCLVLLMNDKRFPWIILVPQRHNLTELHDLNETDTHQLLMEIQGISKQMKFLIAPDKINVAAIGNIVKQLHIHIVARNETDAAWPKPVWGVGDAIEYTPSEFAALKKNWEPLLASLLFK